MKYGIIKAEGEYLNDTLDDFEKQVNQHLAEELTAVLLGGVAVAVLPENDYHSDWYIFIQAFTQ